MFLDEILIQLLFSLLSVLISGRCEDNGSKMADQSYRANGNEALSRRKLTEDFPKTLEEFGYRFNEAGQLRQIENPEAGFVFEVKPGDRNYNQKRYEALGEVLTEEIYKLLETKVGLKKVFIPVDARAEEVRGFFYASDDAFTCEYLMILIHGSGVVRAGQWARKLLINEDIDSGSQLPYITYALQAGYGVVVLNTNQNRAIKSDGDEVHIRGSEDPISHALYVWDHFIRNAAARYIAIVAHSAGGYVTVNLAHERSDEFAKRVFAVAFTDSVHSAKANSPCWDHMVQVARNWVTSNAPLGRPEKRRLNDVDRVSAGTLSHERTSSSAITDIKRFIEYRHDVISGKASSKADKSEEKKDSEDAMETESQFSEFAVPAPVTVDGQSSVPTPETDGATDPSTLTGPSSEPEAPKVEHEGTNGFNEAPTGAQKTEL